jgi:hypothetical protein
MLRCCVICQAEGSPDLQLQYCAVCQSASYCSKACQTKDWGKQHRQICKLLNEGHGDLPVRMDDHTRQSIDLKERFERQERSLDEDVKQFFKLFEESTFEGSQVAARKMKKIAKEQTKHNQKFLLFHSLSFLARFSDLEMLSWPNSPLLVMLQYVNPNVLAGDDLEPLQEGEDEITPLHDVADLADPFEYSTHENQLILARQLIEHGANVNAVSNEGVTPLHDACYGCNVTSLDFIEYLLEKGADPNSQDYLGVTPLMSAAPGAAKFLQNWPTTDASITTQSGASFPARVRKAVKYFSAKVARPDNPDKIQHQLLLQQWREIEVMLKERSVHDRMIPLSQFLSSGCSLCNYFM